MRVVVVLASMCSIASVAIAQPLNMTNPIEKEFRSIWEDTVGLSCRAYFPTYRMEEAKSKLPADRLATFEIVLADTPDDEAVAASLASLNARYPGHPELWQALVDFGQEMASRVVGPASVEKLSGRRLDDGDRMMHELSLRETCVTTSLRFRSRLNDQEIMQVIRTRGVRPNDSDRLEAEAASRPDRSFKASDYAAMATIAAGRGDPACAAKLQAVIRLAAESGSTAYSYMSAQANVPGSGSCVSQYMPR